MLLGLLASLEHRVVDHLACQLLRENEVKAVVADDGEGLATEIRIRQIVRHRGTGFQRICFRLGLSSGIRGVQCCVVRRFCTGATGRDGGKYERDDEQG